MTKEVMQQALKALKEFGYHGSSPRWERTANALTAALEQPVQEPKKRCCDHDSDCAIHNGDALPVGPCDCSLATPPLPVQEDSCFCHSGVSLQSVSGGAAPEGYLGKVTLLIDGEYVDYVKAQPPLPVQEPVACRFCHSKKGCWTWQCYNCGEIDDVQKPAPPQQQTGSVALRMPKVGDKVICLEDESLGEVVSLTAGGSPDIKFDDGSHGTYLLREFAELFGYVTPKQRQPLTDDEARTLEALQYAASKGDGRIVREMKIAPFVIKDETLAQPVQEPVAWMSSDRAWMWSDYSKAIAAVANIPTLTLIPLYAAPPQREWVGLTDEEIEAIGDRVANEQLVGPVSNFRVRFAQAIEQTLKERNT